MTYWLWKNFRKVLVTHSKLISPVKCEINWSRSEMYPTWFSQLKFVMKVMLYEICLLTAKFEMEIRETLFFSVWVFFHNHSRITGLQPKGESIPLTPHYPFHPFHRHLDISWAITAESSPLHIGSSRIRTGNLWFPSASR